MKIQIIKFNDDFKLPERAHYNDAGADVRAMNSYTIEPHETIKIPLGFGIKLPDGYQSYVCPRSGLSSKGIISQIPPIDSGYTGEIHCILTNTTEQVYIVNKYDKIAQLVITPIILADFVEELGSERGANGFGSTDKEVKTNV